MLSWAVVGATPIFGWLLWCFSCCNTGVLAPQLDTSYLHTAVPLIFAASGSPELSVCCALSVKETHADGAAANRWDKVIKQQTLHTASTNRHSADAGNQHRAVTTAAV